MRRTQECRAKGFVGEATGDPVDDFERILIRRPGLVKTLLCDPEVTERRISWICCPHSPHLAPPGPAGRIRSIYGDAPSVVSLRTHSELRRASRERSSASCCAI